MLIIKLLCGFQQHHIERSDYFSPRNKTSKRGQHFVMVLFVRGPFQHVASAWKNNSHTWFPQRPTTGMD